MKFFNLSDLVDRKYIFAGDDINGSLPGDPIFGIQLMPVDYLRRYAANPQYGTATSVLGEQIRYRLPQKRISS